MEIGTGAEERVRQRVRRAIATCATVAAAIGPIAVAHAEPAARPAISELGPGESSPTAERALANAVSFFQAAPAASGATRPATDQPRSATMALRDLLLVRHRLSPEDREVADRLLARPTDGSGDPFGDGYSASALPAENTCTANVCIHWVGSTGDAPPLQDADIDGTPDWVEKTVTVFDQVWAHEIDTLRFRPPKSDIKSTNHGPNKKLDVYLANLGNQGLYGYCTSDDPNLDKPGYRHWDFSAFCVIDDDFAEFPLPGLPSLRVTAAHEFFHASQFAYDIGEDLWLMEGTAVWMEDEVFDGVNDHLQFNATSQLRTPWIPVDLGVGGYRYGAWIFWRFLSERFDAGIVRRVWFVADGAQGGWGLDSLRAAARAIRDRGSTFREAFAEFGAWNTRPSARYEEGGRYGIPHVSRTHGVTGANGGTAWSDLVLDHLSHREVVFRPRAGVTNGARLRLRLDGPRLAAGTEGTAVVRFEDGRTRFFALQVDAGGESQRTVPFGRSVVEWVALVLTNASTRTTCGRNTAFSCEGIPQDDDQRFSYASVLVQ